MDDVARLVEGLLDKAREDLEASRILYERGLKASALNHLEQASEKILKAYFIGYLIDFLRFIYELAEQANAQEFNRDIHRLVKQAVKQYAIPKHLGHDFNAFLNEFLPKLYVGVCGGIFASYFRYSIAHSFIPYVSRYRERILATLMEEGLDRVQAEKLPDAVIRIVHQVPGGYRK